MRKDLALILLVAVAATTLYAVSVEVLTLSTASLPTTLKELRACNNYAVGIDSNYVVHLIDLTTGQDIATYQLQVTPSVEHVDIYCNGQNVYVALAYEFANTTGKYFAYDLLELSGNELVPSSSLILTNGTNYKIVPTPSSSNPVQATIYNNGGTITLVALASLNNTNTFYLGYYMLPAGESTISLTADDFKTFTKTSITPINITGATHIDDNFIVQFEYNEGSGSTTYTSLGTSTAISGISGYPVAAYGNSDNFYLITNSAGSFNIYNVQGSTTITIATGATGEPTFVLISNPVIYSYDENSGTSTQLNVNILAAVYTVGNTLHVNVLSTNVPLESSDFRYGYVNTNFVPNYMPADTVYGVSGTVIQPLKLFAYEGASNQVVVNVGTYIYNNIISKLSNVLTTVSDIKNTLLQANQTLSTVYQYVQSISTTVDQIKTSVDTLTNVPQTLQNIIDLINKINATEIYPTYDAVQKIKTDMNTVVLAVNAATTSVNALTTTINNLVLPKLDSISNTLTQTNQTLDSINSQLSQIEQNIITLGKNLDQFNATITSQLQNLQTQTSNIYNLLENDVIPTLNSIHTNIQDLSNNIQATYSRVVELETYLQGNITELQNAISQAKTELQSAIESANTTLQTQIESALNALDQIQSYVDQIQSQLSALDTIKTGLEQLNSTISTLNATTNELLKNAISQVSELTTISQKINEMLSLCNSVSQEIATLKPVTETQTVTVTTTTGTHIAGPWLLALAPSLLAKKIRKKKAKK